MTIDTQFIEELRAQFKRGATPSRLIRLIIKHLGENVDHWMIRKCLMETFALPLVRHLRPADTYPSNAELKYVFLNKVMIPEMIQERQHWDSSSELCWLDGLPSACSDQAKERVRTTICPGLSEETWAKLNSMEQESLRVLMASSQVLSERVDILAKLAERLQQQVEEFEEQHGGIEQENSA